MLRSLLILGAAAVMVGFIQTDAPPMRTMSNTAFTFGERLEYDVQYSFIKAGTAAFTIAPKPVRSSGRPCYDIRFEVSSLKSLDYVYRVRDKYRTLVDVDGIFPWRFDQMIREGGYKRDFSAVFNQNTQKAYTTDGTFDIPPFVHDIVSAFYYVRATDLSKKKPGDVITMRNFFDRESHELLARITGRETVEVEAGTFRTIVIEPIIKSGGLFKFEGKLVLWLSDDDRKVPVKVSTRIPIGSVDAELTAYSGLRGPFTAKLK
jgi:hypothetical protein